jgi:hypothetical protein
MTDTFHLEQARRHWDQIKQGELTAADIPELVRMVELLFILAAKQREGHGNH